MYFIFKNFGIKDYGIKFYNRIDVNNLPGTPRNDIDVGDCVEDEKHRHGRNCQEIQDPMQKIPYFLHKTHKFKELD